MTDQYDVLEPDGFGSIGGFAWRCKRCGQTFTSSLVGVLDEQVTSHGNWHATVNLRQWTAFYGDPLVSDEERGA